MLDKLFNPKNFNNPIKIDGYNVDILKRTLSSMILIRKTENKLALEKKKWINYWTGSSWCGSGSNSRWYISKFKKD